MTPIGPLIRTIRSFETSRFFNSKKQNAISLGRRFRRLRPRGGRKRVDYRAVLTGILFLLRTGLPWHHLLLGRAACKRHDRG